MSIIAETLLSALANNLGNAGGILPQNKSRYQLGIDDAMNRNPGGFDLGLKSGATSVPPIGGEGEITVTGEDPGINEAALSPGTYGSGGGGEGGGPGGGGGGGGQKGGGGLPPWMEKLGAGLKVGEAFKQELPRPPSLPGGGRFSPSSSILQWLQMTQGR